MEPEQSFALASYEFCTCSDEMRMKEIEKWLFDWFKNEDPFGRLIIILSQSNEWPSVFVSALLFHFNIFNYWNSLNDETTCKMINAIQRCLGIPVFRESSCFRQIILCMADIISLDFNQLSVLDSFDHEDQLSVISETIFLISSPIMKKFHAYPELFEFQGTLLEQILFSLDQIPLNEQFFSLLMDSFNLSMTFEPFIRFLELVNTCITVPHLQQSVFALIYSIYESAPMSQPREDVDFFHVFFVIVMNFSQHLIETNQIEEGLSIIAGLLSFNSFYLFKYINEPLIGNIIEQIYYYLITYMENSECYYELVSQFVSALTLEYKDTPEIYPYQNHFIEIFVLLVKLLNESPDFFFPQLNYFGYDFSILLSNYDVEDFIMEEFESISPNNGFISLLSYCGGFSDSILLGISSKLLSSNRIEKCVLLYFHRVGQRFPVHHLKWVNFLENSIDILGIESIQVISYFLSKYPENKNLFSFSLIQKLFHYFNYCTISERFIIIYLLLDFIEVFPDIIQSIRNQSMEIFNELKDEYGRCHSISTKIIVLRYIKEFKFPRIESKEYYDLINDFYFLFIHVLEEDMYNTDFEMQNYISCIIFCFLEKGWDPHGLNMMQWLSHMLIRCPTYYHARILKFFINDINMNTMNEFFEYIDIGAHIEFIIGYLDFAIVICQENPEKIFSVFSLSFLFETFKSNQCLIYDRSCQLLVCLIKSEIVSKSEVYTALSIIIESCIDNMDSNRNALFINMLDKLIHTQLIDSKGFLESLAQYPHLHNSVFEVFLAMSEGSDNDRLDKSLSILNEKILSH